MALGGDVFCWTADEQTSCLVLDEYVRTGGNFIDTADVYSAWAPDHTGGESESVIGRWLKRSGCRDELVIASKVGKKPDRPGLSEESVAKAVGESLSRLGISELDLYYAHEDDLAMPIDEKAGVFSSLVDSGDIRAIGVSNFSARRLESWVQASRANAYHPPVAVQPLYNLMERGFERLERDVARAAGLAVIPYSALAGGFLSGKYRSGSRADSARTDGTSAYSVGRGPAVTAALKAIAGQQNVPIASVAIAWLRAQPTVVAPISSARRLDQLPALIAGARLVLTTAEISVLQDVSDPVPGA
ncbi:MAG: aldo/keto reductase [Nakamurella sp.]